MRCPSDSLPYNNYIRSFPLLLKNVQWNYIRWKITSPSIVMLLELIGLFNFVGLRDWKDSWHFISILGMVVAFLKEHKISWIIDVFGTEEVWPEMSRNIYDDKVQRQFLFIQNVLEYHKLFYLRILIVMSTLK